jgi:hypothetical protein
MWKGHKFVLKQISEKDTWTRDTSVNTEKVMTMIGIENIYNVNISVSKTFTVALPVSVISYQKYCNVCSFTTHFTVNEYEVV